MRYLNYRGDWNWEKINRASDSRAQRTPGAFYGAQLRYDPGTSRGIIALRPRQGCIYRRGLRQKRNLRRGHGRDSLLRRVWGVAAGRSGKNITRPAGTQNHKGGKMGG